MDVRVLGPVEVRLGSRLLALGTPQTRAVLAVLLIRRGDVVSVDRLVDELWPSAPPADARSLVHGHVSRLRRALRLSTLGEEAARRLVTRKPGYLLRVEDDELDVARFERLLIEARAAHQDGDPDRCVAAFREAQQQWRGEPYADVPQTPLVAAEATRLAGLRLSSLEERFDAELRAGLHADIVADLTAITAHHPLRERLIAQLMLALHGIGNTTEALALYERTRHRLVDELGLDPGTVLREVHTAILRDDPSAAPPGQLTGALRPLPTPRQLPPDVAGFTGRDRELANLERVLAGAGQQGPVVISAIQGSGGIGKSALAIHAAHRLGDRFPDGQLYVDLHGSTVGLSPLEPLEVLGRFLRALGVDPAAVPTGLEEASALFRSLVAGRRLLVVLDNAVDAAQVLPLLPGSQGCGVLVTGRRTLGSLPGARHLELDLLPVEEAMELLGRLAGAERVAREPEAAAEVARWCGYLPLALRIASARLAARPAWPVAALAERLADAQRRLDELELADGGVRTSLAVSYEQLCDSADAVDRVAATAFALLGVLDGPDMGVPVMARLLELPEETAERVAERLVDVHLLETRSPGRYRLHDLLRLYARELVGQHHPETERVAALGRVLGFYAATAWETLALLRPGDHRLARADGRWSLDRLPLEGEQAALAWLEAERANLLVAVGQAAATPGVPAELATQLAHALSGFFLVRNYSQDWVQANRTALQVARRTGDRAAQAQAYNDLGIVHRYQGRYGEAVACHQQSLVLRRELGDPLGQAASLGNLGIVYERLGRFEQALACHQESLEICRELGDLRGQAMNLCNLGVAYERQGRLEQALECLRGSLAMDRELGDRHGQATSLRDLGVVYQRLARYEEARSCHQESLAIYRQLGDRFGQAASLGNLGVVYERQGRSEQALACLRGSVALYRELGVPHGQAESLREIGVALRALGKPAEARAHWQEALAILEQLHTADADQVRALLASLSGPVSPGR